MIRRHLVITPSRVFFTSSKADFDESPKIKMCELKMPIEVFQEAEKKIAHCDYLTTTDIMPIDLNENFKDLFKSLNRFAVNEKDRVWLFEQSKKS